MNKYNHYLLFVLAAALSFSSVSCVVEPVTGRRQLMTASRLDERNMSLETWSELQESLVPSKRVQLVGIVRETGENIARAVEAASSYKWSFHLFEGTQANAFSLPDGKVALYEGIFLCVKNEAELAAVIGHEIGHVVARHGAERMSQQELVDAGENVLELAFSHLNVKYSELWLMAYAGLTRAGYVCPYSREHEYIADRLAMIFMARAGYDPSAAVDFWSGFSQEKNGRNFDLFATHPSNSKRVANLGRYLPEAMSIYQVSPRKGKGATFTIRKH